MVGFELIKDSKKTPAKEERNKLLTRPSTGDSSSSEPANHPSGSLLRWSSALSRSTRAFPSLRIA
jgi:hypothetical protein